MRKPAVAALLATLAVAVLVSTTAAAVLEDTELRDGEHYFISYRTDGGTLPPGSPEFYVHGSSASLPVPKKDGMWFAGWCTEAALTNPIMGIPAELRGHVVLYAKWVEDTRLGTGWTMEVSGEYRNGDVLHTVEGTATYGYDAVTDDAVLIGTSNDIEFSWPGGGWTDTSSSARWCRSVTDGWTYAGNETVNGEKLTVWTSGGSTMWVRDLMVPMRMTVPAGDDGTILYETVDVRMYEPDTSFEPRVSADYPLDVTVSGSDATEPLFLYAEGEGFEGWYVNGVLATMDRTLTVPRPDPSDTYQARSSVGYVVVDDASEIRDMGFAGVPVFDSTGNLVDDASEPGLYTASRTVDGVDVTLTFLVEDSRAFSLSWTFDGRTYRYDDTVLLSEAYLHGFENPNLPRFGIRTQSHVETFYTPDAVMLRLAAWLAEQGEGMDRLDYARFVLSMVQSIPYLEDIDTRGTDEFWKFPAETLWDGGGDCEDKTFVFGTVMGLSGYRTGFLLFWDHAMPVLEIDAPGYAVDIEGYRFVMCETVSDAFELGQSTEGHRPGDELFSCRIESLRCP